MLIRPAWRFLPCSQIRPQVWQLGKQRGGGEHAQETKFKKRNRAAMTGRKGRRKSPSGGSPGGLEVEISSGTSNVETIGAKSVVQAANIARGRELMAAEILVIARLSVRELGALAKDEGVSIMRLMNYSSCDPAATPPFLLLGCRARQAARSPERAPLP